MSVATATPDLQGAQQGLAGTSQVGQEATKDDPNKGTPEQNQQAVQLSDNAKRELLNLRRDYKLSWTPNRRAIVRRVLKAFEVLKGNAYPSFDPDAFQWYDAITAAIDGNNGASDPEFYRFNNNIYQMLMLSFVAALSPQVPKCRYQPDNADDETDLATARRASTMMAIIERKNNIQSLQKQELMHLWTGGAYASYVRYVIDGDRFGSSKVPIIEPVDTQVLPDRFVCPECGSATPASEFVWSQAICPECGYQMGSEDFYEGESLPLPTEVGKEEVPNGMVKIGVYGPLNWDAAPYAQDLYETPIFDFEVETDIASVRASYEGAWEQLPSTVGHNSVPEAEADRLARIQQTSASGTRSGYLSNTLITYSRCWIQRWAFNHINDKAVADELKGLFPNGCKLVTAGGEFLEAVPANLTEQWTWCGTIRGMGLYPFAVGDAALDVQDRINDVANTVHEHMDRTASPTILVDEDAVDGEKLSGQTMPPGRLTLIKRKGALAARPLSDVMFQPQFHVDNQIYNYGQNLILLAELVSGVLPQIFGGTQEDVQTFRGQRQQLNVALGRLGLFWEQIREEHAARAENAVKCFAQNMPEKVRNVIDSEGEGFENEWVLLSEMQGSFHAYPEADQGFPMMWAEIRDRLVEMLGNLKDNPFVSELLADPDNAKVIARYVLPDQIKIPGDAERVRVKRLLAELAQGEPLEVTQMDAAAIGVITPLPLIFLPQTQTGLQIPDQDFDDMGMIVQLSKEWGQKNWKMKETNPGGYENVRAYLRIAAQFLQQAAARQLVAATQAAAEQGAPDGEGAPEAPPAGATS